MWTYTTSALRARAELDAPSLFDVAVASRENTQNASISFPVKAGQSTGGNPNTNLHKKGLALPIFCLLRIVIVNLILPPI